jgi:hypothetical protein
MGEFLKLTGDPADVIGAATLITGAAESLKADLAGLFADVARLDTPAVLGHDEFAANFDHSYRSPQPTATGDKPADQATRDAANGVGDIATAYGGAIVSAMQDYTVTDGRAKADIDATPAV